MKQRIHSLLRLSKALGFAALLLLALPIIAAAETFGRPVSHVNVACVFDDLHCAKPGWYHTGVDYAGTTSDDILACNCGTIRLVSYSGPDDKGLGNCAVIEHVLTSGTKVYTLYGHMSSFASGLHVGQIVMKGQTIGKMGGSGYGNPNKWVVHVHLEFKSSATLGNPSGQGSFWGYTPTPAEGYGYYPPANYLLSNIEATCPGQSNGPPEDAGWQFIGRTTKSPFSAIEQNGRLWVLHNGFDNAKMYEGSMDAARNWSTDWRQLPGETDDAPSMDTFGGLRFYLHRGQNSRMYWSWFNSYNSLSPAWNQQYWVGWFPTSGGTPTAPAMSVYGSQVYFLHRGFDNRMYLGFWDIYGGYYSWDRYGGWWQLDGATADRPGLARLNGELWAIHRGLDDRIYTRNLSRGGSWFNSSNGATPSAPSMTDFQGRMYIIHRGENNGVYYGSMNPDGRFNGWRQLPGETLMQPGITAFNSRLYATRVGPSGRMYIQEVAP